MSLQKIWTISGIKKLLKKEIQKIILNINAYLYQTLEEELSQEICTNTNNILILSDPLDLSFT